jgi:Fe-S-cluster containining protein
MSPTPHPCLTCGACCGSFRVSFYWSEPVPEEFTEKLNDFRACMKHAQDPERPRCIALGGEIGRKVACGIYENRPTPCRDFTASFEDGQSNPRCDQARARYGLPPLTLQDWSA